MKKLLFYLILCFLISCNSDSSDSNSPVIPETTQVLNEENINEIQEITQDNDGDSFGYTITVPSSSQLARNLETGSIIAGGITDKTPYGMLQKVVSMETEGGITTIKTEPAALNEAIQDVKLDQSFVLNQKDIAEAKCLLPGVKARAVPPAKNSAKGFNFNYEFLNVVLYSNQYGSIQAGANFSLNITPRFYLDIVFFRLERLGYQVTVNQESRVSINASIGYAFTKNIPLYSFTFNPIVIQAGYVPIVLVPKITIYLEFDGSISAQAEAGIRQYYNFNRHLYYTASDNAWKNEKTQEIGFEPIWPAASLDCAAKIHAGPICEILLYGLLGPYVRFAGYLDFNVIFSVPMPDPYLTLDAGLEGAIGINLFAIADGLGTRIEYPFDLLNYRILELSPYLPDLVPDSVEVVSAAGMVIYGQKAAIQVHITNPADYDAVSPFKIVCELYNEGSAVPSHRYEQTVQSLSSHGEADVSFNDWVPQKGTDTGNKTVKITIDPDNSVYEADEGNNELNYNFTISEMPPTT